MNTTEPFALSDFVSCDETRPALCKPWKHGDYVYATDGRIMVRVSADLFPEVAPCADPNAPYIQAQSDKLFSEPPPPDDHWLSPTTEMSEVKPVKGDKGDKCDKCSTVFNVPHTAIRIGNAALNCFYIEKLCRLPGVMLHLAPDRKELDVVPFRFDHGIGVLMPMKVS